MQCPVTTFDCITCDDTCALERKLTAPTAATVPTCTGPAAACRWPACSCYDPPKPPRRPRAPITKGFD